MTLNQSNAALAIEALFKQKNGHFWSYGGFNFIMPFSIGHPTKLEINSSKMILSSKLEITFGDSLKIFMAPISCVSTKNSHMFS